MHDDLVEWNDALVAAARPIKVLRAFAWPQTLRGAFLDAWRAGRKQLPTPPPPKPLDPSLIEQLTPLAEREGDDPASSFLARTSRSYLTAALLLQSTGTADFTRHSVELYGAPSQAVTASGLSNLAAAERFSEVSARWSTCAPEEDAPLSAAETAAAIEARARTFLTGHPLAVTLDPNLAAKCSAGADEIRLRAGSSYSRNELAQLVHHELEVHSATCVNGSLQPLSALSLGAPRTTAHQEGLATFAELITGTIDIDRLRRVSLRVRAIDLALRGADFLDVFEFFLENGQSEDESYHSAARIFRGGDVRGGSVFTKDAVYLRGLFEVHAFFNAAFEEGRIDLIDRFFSGRMTCADAVELGPLYEGGGLVGPRYLPEWARSKGQLAAYLAFASLTHGVEMGSLRLESLVQREVAGVPPWLEREEDEPR